MKTFLSFVMLSVLCLPGLFAAEVRIEESEKWVTLKNGESTLSFNLDNGLYYILDRQGRKVVDYAWFQLGGLQSKDKEGIKSFTASDVQDELGRGKRLLIRAAFDHYADILWTATMYEGKPYIVFSMGVDNDTDREYRLMNYHPLSSGRVFEGEDNSVRYRILDGLGGGGKTMVRCVDHFLSFNNILVRFGRERSREFLWPEG